MDQQMQDYLELSIDRKLDSIRTDVKRIMEIVDHYKSGFPGDDPLGHRQYHESLIERNKAYADLGRKLMFELAKWGLIGFIGWLLVAGWHDIISTIRSTR